MVNWTKFIATAIAMALISAGLVHAQTKITAYGYAGDTTSDSNSANGIGNHDNHLTPFQGSGGVSDAALTSTAAQQYGVSVGQTFTVTGANGSSYTLRYEDTAPESDSRVDIYDPNQLLTGGNDNNFSTSATSLNNGPVVAWGSAPAAVSARLSSVVDDILSKYKGAGQSWASTLQNATTTLFWLLALISLSWTCISLAIKQADLMQIVSELFRYIMFTGLFFWLLMNGPAFANDIVNSLRELGGSASGTGQAIYPGTLINLGMQVFQQEIGHINILLPAATGIPAAIAVIILILCSLIAVNMVLLLCAAWVVLYAGLIFLGFGGCRWTSDMAINYYRTMLGVGVSLMTMQLIIGIGVDFLKQLVASTGTNPDVGQVAIVMCATIILAVISHRLPHMVAGMVVGGGHNGAIGGVGIMTLIGGSIAGASLAARATGTPVGTVAGAAGDQAAKQLQERIASTEAAMAAGSAGGAPISSAGGSANAGGVSTASSGAGGGSRGGSGFSSLVQQSGRGTGGKQAGFNAQGAGAQSGSPGPAPGTSSNRVAEAEPPQDRPMSPDEQRGFGPDGNGNPSGGDQVT